MINLDTSKIFEQYPDVVGVDELCKMLGGISRKLAYRILRKNEISSVRIGREYKVAKVDVIDFIVFRKVPTDC